MRSPPCLACLALLAPLLAGCGREQAQREEAARVVGAIDALIQSDRASKPQRLDQLRAVPCSLPDVCEARRACVDAFTPVAEAAKLQQEARALLDQQNPDLAPQVDARLDKAEQLLKQAGKLQETCVSATTSVRQGHRL